LERIRPVLSLSAKPISILLLTILYLVFVFLIFPGVATPTTAPPIDLAFHYSVEQVYEWIELYGEEGRRRYMIGELTVDFVYPIIYTGLFCGLIGFFTSVGQKGKHSSLAALPIAIWLFDMFENTGIVTMLYRYPEKLHMVASVTAWFTSIKWTLAVAVIFMIVVLGVRYVYLKFV
jgi:hypothetical protein